MAREPSHCGDTARGQHCQQLLPVWGTRAQCRAHCRSVQIRFITRPARPWSPRRARGAALGGGCAICQVHAPKCRHHVQSSAQHNALAQLVTETLQREQLGNLQHTNPTGQHTTEPVTDRLLAASQGNRVQLYPVRHSAAVTRSQRGPWTRALHAKHNHRPSATGAQG
jgi:hypothetical protein